MRKKKADRFNQKAHQNETIMQPLRSMRMDKVNGLEINKEKVKGIGLLDICSRLCFFY